MPFKVVVSTDWLASGQGVIIHCSWSRLLPIWFSCFSAPGAETPLRPRSHLRGGDLLYLAVNGSASLFSCLSFPHSTCQGIFLASYCPASHRAFYGKGSFLSFCNVYSRIINPENVFLLLGFLKIAFLTPFFFFYQP